MKEERRQEEEEERLGAEAQARCAAVCCAVLCSVVLCVAPRGSFAPWYLPARACVSSHLLRTSHIGLSADFNCDCDCELRCTSLRICAHCAGCSSCGAEEGGDEGGGRG